MIKTIAVIALLIGCFYMGYKYHQYKVIQQIKREILSTTSKDLKQLNMDLLVNWQE